MLPQVDPATIEHGSERPVYVALRDQLSEEFTVLHSYPWLRRGGRAKALQEGEADFVVLHHQLGLLVLEVKGGVELWHEDRKWFRRTSGGTKEIKDPFEQAKRSMHELAKFACERSRGKLADGDFVYGHAVVFPQMDFEGPLPHHVDRATLISRPEARQMESAIRRAFRSWAPDPRRQLSRDGFKVLCEALLPKFKLVRRIGPEVQEIRQGLMELTEEQAEAVAGIYENDRVLVKGAAGSGKTVLALIRAKTLAQEGKRTLFVCYNKALASWLRRQAREDPDSSDWIRQLTINHFHGMARDLANKADLEYNPPQEESAESLKREFYEEHVPILIEEAVNKNRELGADIRFDALVVDEAQDFRELWWDVLTKSLLQDPATPIYAFMDPNQTLWEQNEEASILSNFPVYRLPKNCRNTQLIAVTSAHIMSLRPEPDPRSPQGNQLEIHQLNEISDQKREVIKRLKELMGKDGMKPCQIAVIGPSRLSNGSLKNVATIKGVPLTSNSDEWLDGCGLLVTTSRSFKGLEADIVVLYDLEKLGKKFQRADLYVACTRAKARLVAFAHGSECSTILQKAKNAAQIYV